MNKAEEKSKQYRDYREQCGIKDPIMLDEIDEAYYEGYNQAEKDLMEKAIDVEVKVDAGGYPYIDKTIELYDYYKDVPLAKGGDNVKVIVILEK